MKQYIKPYICMAIWLRPRLKVRALGLAAQSFDLFGGKHRSRLASCARAIPAA